jgi:hypothetical protein
MNLTSPPPAPTGVRVVRWSFGGIRREDIPCHTMYAGHDGETHWWAIRTITDEWILPTDTITHDWMPDDHAISGYTNPAVAA